jgi:hypothetical protein
MGGAVIEDNKLKLGACKTGAGAEALVCDV